MILNFNESEVQLLKMLTGLGDSDLPKVGEDWQPEDKEADGLKTLLEDCLSVSTGLLLKMDAETIHGSLNIDLFGAGI